MKRARCILQAAALLAGAFLLNAAPVGAQVTPGDTDLTLKAMRDEMERSRTKLRLGDLPGPFFIEYRLLDFEVKSVSASFGAVLNSTTTRNRIMSVDVRIGDYRLDSSNFISADGFQGFIGSTGTVGIDGDYESLRQDLWLATDQAYKSALDAMARKQAYIRNLSRAPDVDDFSREEPVKLVRSKQAADWTSRNWEEEARTASGALRAFPDLHGSRVSYHLIYVTQYLMTSEGTEVRVSRSVAGIEGGAETLSPDGMPLHNFYTAYAVKPADLPAATAVRDALSRVGQELVALRTAPLAQDYVGPVLFESSAAGSLLAQLLGPSVSGARGPLAPQMFEQRMEMFGGRNEWSGRLGTRVLPAGVSLVSDPTARDFRGTPLIGSYEVDEEGVRGQRVVLVENGTLRGLLMSRRPGSDFRQSNGHARTAFLNDPKPAISNLLFESSETLGHDALRRKFMDACKAEGRSWCMIVRRMDNPVLGIQRRQDFNEYLGGLLGATSSGTRAPLLVYKVNVEDGREEMVRGAMLNGITLRALRNVAGIGDDPSAFQFFQDTGILGTSLGAFGSAQSGVPTSVVAPSLLLEEVEVRGARGEPKRPPVLPAPPLEKSSDK